MEKNSSEKTKPKTKKVRFNLNAPKTEMVSLTGDLNGCVLVIPETFGMNKHTTYYQWRFPEYHLCSLCVKDERQVHRIPKEIQNKEKIMLIYVWNLSLNVSENNFRETFEAFGQVSFAIISSTILRDRYSGQLQTFALVEMPDQAEARAAIKNLNRKALLGRQMIVYGSSEN